MKFEIQLPAGLVILGLFLAPLQADELSGANPADKSNDILATLGDVTLTHAEIDAEFSKIPAENRLALIRDGERVQRTIQRLLHFKVAAEAAIAAHYDEEPIVKGRMALAAEKELAEAWLLKVVEDAPEADYETLAHEYYLANPDAFMTDEAVDVSHILVNSEDRSSEEALQLATSLREQLLEDPSRFNEMVMEFSDDPSKGSNGGRFPAMTRGQMVKPFEKQAFLLENIGDISEPVETAYGYHIIRLNGKFPPTLMPFEEVKADAMAQAREKYLREYRSRYLKQLLAGTIEIQEGAAEVLAKRYFGENLELSPDYQE
jgi:parvulin-like peptidyl-prolyl isomerase